MLLFPRPRRGPTRLPSCGFLSIRPPLYSLPEPPLIKTPTRYQHSARPPSPDPTDSFPLCKCPSPPLVSPESTSPRRRLIPSPPCLWVKPPLSSPFVFLRAQTDFPRAFFHSTPCLAFPRPLGQCRGSCSETVPFLGSDEFVPFPTTRKMTPTCKEFSQVPSLSPYSNFSPRGLTLGFKLETVFFFFRRTP